ncbi:hypothetical protein A3J19_02915 [Candidatus Daviesbacteria bacterium RIFCSPLOWO2_02_FULL_41_8]|uniref:Uncharacterized protein n=2 Tax=Candidatus Daviesiibacteriota TaxID=1752718 RepID=A0A1F5NLT6_9BACT|nr:MAG: hypothetical protein A3D83_02990 [Candidatus Daviesbacteria bacterium RIFCSPHIGHO2_02_FULL_41_10]OGE62556.1 MAG: hypothetical protein A2967_01920 [Candidatus Daviesbacteria bacterium RIFCSPLOWO2_01_FULL_41_32]OGE78484.1 MAG: hypothetical protein A3J19_02915 [Candidatus Daviesbacteria bacterium RIFCSPLOWO2_02_FULL_41_8]
MDKRSFVWWLWVLIPILAILYEKFSFYLNNTQQKILQIILLGLLVFLIYFYIPVMLKLKSKLYIFLMIITAILLVLLFSDYQRFLKADSIIP